jgi:hypothetical protein
VLRRSELLRPDEIDREANVGERLKPDAEPGAGELRADVANGRVVARRAGGSVAAVRVRDALQRNEVPPHPGDRDRLP